MKQATKSDRTKQVQFRMPTVLHNQLRKILIDDNVSMADLFNKAAEEYVNKFILNCKQTNCFKNIQTGIFGADMKVLVENDGPVSIIIDTENK